MGRRLMSELGYTPQNLLDLMYQYGLERKDVANIVGVSYPAIGRYTAPLGASHHSTMPADKWKTLVDYCNEHKAIDKDTMV